MICIARRGSRGTPQAVALVRHFLTITPFTVLGFALVDRAGILWVLVVAMRVKALVMGGWFMHLGFERTALVLSVVVGTRDYRPDLPTLG